MKTFIETLVVLLVVLVLSGIFTNDGLSQMKDKPITYFSAHKNPAEAISTMIKNPPKGCKVLLIFFGVDWCPWCHRLVKIMDENEKISAYLKEHYSLIKIDIGKWDKNLDLAEK
jgi:thioredoxin-related protein